MFVSDLGDTYYVDFERIRKVDGYVYYWDLKDNLKPTPNGRLSSKTYKQGDCKLFRLKYLSFSFHNEPMGKGVGDGQEPIGEHRNWKYPPPTSANEYTLKSACSYVGE